MVDSSNAADDGSKSPDENKGGTHKPTEPRALGNDEKPIVDPPQTCQQPAKQHRDLYDKANLTFLGLTFFAAVLAAIFTGLAWCTFEGQLEEMRRAYGPLKDAAIAAKSSADTTRMAMELDQRAWIVPTGAAFFDKPITDQSRIKIEFANRGKTPAWEVGQIDEIPVTLPYRRVGADQVPYIDDKSPAWPTKPLCTKDEIVPIGSVNPSQETYYVRHGARGNIPDLKKGGVIIVVRGCFVYRDAFGRRKSPYCFYSVPTRAGWGRIESQGIPKSGEL